jgi:geranylgeranyl pyrophosphate synthase
MKTVTAAFDLAAYLAAEWKAVEAVRRRLATRLLDGLDPAVAEPIRYALDAGGKRLRPILCVAAYRAVAGPPVPGENGPGDGESGAQQDAAIYEIANALELIHTYSLVHDDLPCMDDDDLRRGRPTTHRVYGEPGAVAAGATLIPLAALTLDAGGRSLGLEPATRVELVRELCQAAGAAGMVGGQWLDLEAEGRAIDLAELEGIHHQKTGALLAAAARLGGLAAGADSAALAALATYGQALGLAFQIADDILDLTGDSALLGKTAGRDLTLAKATYPALLGLDGARELAWAEADRAIVALRRANLATPPLVALARYAVERDH